MTFNDTYNYLLSLQNLPRKEYMNHPRHCGIYLKRLQFFLNILGNPEKKIPRYIHVAGTSGKGSVTAFLHSILQAAGKKVGSTQSPHQTAITERWKIGNQYMNKKEFIDLVEFIKPKLDEYIRTTPYDMLSFFEIIEAIGFIYFARHKVQWLVLETGCGGRFDSSNVIPRKDIAVITTIGLDHVGIIGDNKSEIAYEKAGIIKHGCKVFTMEGDEKIVGIIEKECEKNKAKLNHVSHTTYHVSNFNLNNTQFIYQNETFCLSTIGEHQVKNAILCIEIARALGIPENAIKTGLAKTKQPLRMEIVSKNPLIILDGAHNPDKMGTTVATLQHFSTSAHKPINQSTIKPINLIVGFSSDKNYLQMIKQLSTLKPKSIACTRNTVNPFRKVADPQDIARRFKKFLPKSKIQIFLDPRAALNWSKKQYKKNSGLILATGSIFLSGELRHRL
ncbi:MAG: Mur ligase family protein [Patescibacteria group bacterium]